MKRSAKTVTVFAVVAVSMVATLALSQTSENRPKDSITPAQAKLEVEQLASELRQARQVAKKISDKPTRDRMELLLGQSELRARDLAENLGRVKSAPPAVAGLSKVEFDKHLAGLKKESFDDGILTYVENFLAPQPLYCEQAAAVAKMFSSDNQRSKAVILLYPKLIDKPRFNDVLNTFSFDSSKKTTRQAVGLK